MIKLNRILIPTAFCPGSKAAYDHAQMLVEQFGGKIDFIHVVPTLKYFHESMKKVGYPLSLEKDVYPKVAQEAEEHAKADMEKFIGEEFRGKVIVKIATKPSEAIVKHAKKNDYDLIIMGTRSEDPLDTVLGTVTERVIRYSEIPVLSVPPRKQEVSFKSILVPSDYSENSMKALRPAIRLAASLDAEVTLLHVRELYGSESDNDPGSKGGDTDQNVEIRLANKVEAFFKTLSDFDVSLESSDKPDERIVVLNEEGQSHRVRLKLDVVKGLSAHYEIVDYAANNSDLICLTTHGRSGIASLFLGSTAEKVTKWSTVPVITTRSVMYEKKS